MEESLREQCPTGGDWSEELSPSQQTVHPRQRPRRGQEHAGSVGLCALGVESRGTRCREGALRMLGTWARPTGMQV